MALLPYLCSLIPPRIAHQPGVVLDVVTTDDNQGDSSSVGVSSNNSHAVGEFSASARDVASLRIRGTGYNSQSLIVGPQENELQQMPASTSNQPHLGAGDNMVQPEKPHLFQQQMEELVERIQQTDQKMEDVLAKIQQTDQKLEGVLARIQQTDQQREHTQQQTQHQIDRILQSLQQTNRQHVGRSNK